MNAILSIDPSEERSPSKAFPPTGCQAYEPQSHKAVKIIDVGKRSEYRLYVHWGCGMAYRLGRFWGPPGKKRACPVPDSRK
jgi:hypothetical protein